MEKERIDNLNHSRYGTSLKELLPFVIESRKGKPGQRISDRVVWLSQVIETEDFWTQLGKYIAKDDGEKRHSVGGVFTRDYGKKQIDFYSWYELHSSLDNFLKNFDMRATEFLFRDFQPQNSSTELARKIDAVRSLTVTKYPRLRRLYWDDYQKTLESSGFWQNLIIDLGNLNKPTHTYGFFPKSLKLTDKELLTLRERRIELKQALRLPVWTIHGQLDQKARFVEYGNFAQIIKGLYGKDPRAFLLEYKPTSENPFLQETVREAKVLLEKKLLPLKPKPEITTKLTKKEFEKIINSKEFWLFLTNDLERHFNSKKPTYSFSFFLRHYDSKTNELRLAKTGTYAILATTRIHELKGLRKRLIKPSKNLVQYLMWEFIPSEGITQLVAKAKSLCAELFPQDCLYVVLQTQEFWTKFEKNLQLMQGVHTFASFLRFFDETNPKCSRLSYKKGKPKYQYLFHRAYHKEREFLEFLKSIGIEDVFDHKDGLTKLFLYTSPFQTRETLLKKFPKDFDGRFKEQQLKSDLLLQKAKKILNEIKISGQVRELSFENKDEIRAFRIKLQIAARSLKLKAITNLKNNILTIKIGEKMKFPPSKRAPMEAEVKRLKLKGLSNEEIAKRLGKDVKAHHVEYALKKLRDRGEISIIRAARSKTSTVFDN